MSVTRPAFGLPRGQACARRCKTPRRSASFGAMREVQSVSHVLNQRCAEYTWSVSQQSAGRATRCCRLVPGGVEHQTPVPNCHGMQKRRTAKNPPRRPSKSAGRRTSRMAPLRLVEGDDFRVNQAKGGLIDISATGMTRIVEEWMKGRRAVLVVNGTDAVRINS